MSKKLLLPVIMVQAFAIISVAPTRGYFAIGGEWLIVPIYLLIAYGWIPTLAEFYRLIKEELK
ncbi:hypothetical protein CS063_15035 [Sporanaerobium hydrogeniformans]|uniref:Uncharacterized protein n=1 Tax=Sporanaerobium hydrogeniformans TaxID=3072179 RepID=A0AC61D905_9FIRM|nr:hypothetical protein [Sporanaerobium hydrogeniformans]PHV69558.1 hypothetical protein CS063_15035 [Sporanaerobium hydrogeniformans]